ncbi:MAG TPA: permease-like cell division protein FtsX [Bacteroidota bacterium]|nr:permease-like cell division protein FtsX [Bacteroidota bacterium]
MSFSYTMRESISGFRRAKLSSLLSIATICISLLFLGIFAGVSINATRLIEALRSRLEMEAFLVEPMTDEDVDALRTGICSIEGVEAVTYVSKDSAAKVFKQEFGEDINKVLDFNPLPPSFKITMKERYRTSVRTQQIYDRLVALPGVESVIYRKTLLELIDQRAASLDKALLWLGVAVSLSAVFLVANTIRLAIAAKRRLIRTMELVGATRAFVRRPFLLEGILQGLFGGLLAAGSMALLFEYAARFASAEVAPYLHMPIAFYAAVALAGVVLGFAGSLISVVRFVRPSAAQ